MGADIWIGYAVAAVVLVAVTLKYPPMPAWAYRRALARAEAAREAVAEDGTREH